MLKRFFGAALCLLCVQIVFSQHLGDYHNVYVHSLAVEDGLSQSNITQVLQDSKGFVWICTENGLNRYDGYDFKVYKNDPKDTTSIGSNHINFIFEDSKQRLWIGTNTSGINLYNRAKDNFQRFKHQPENNNSLSQDAAVSICESKDGRLWIGTYWGLNRFDPEKKIFQRFYEGGEDRYGLLNNGVTAVMEDHLGNIWAGTGDGLTILHHLSGTDYTMTHFRHDFQDERSPSSPGIATLYEDENRNVWVGTNNGLDQFAWPDDFNKQFGQMDFSKNVINDWSRGAFRHFDKTGNFRELTSGMVLSMAEPAARNELWIGVDGKGVKVLNLQTNELESVSSNNDMSIGQIAAYDMFFDKDNTVWISTHSDGVKIFSANPKNFEHIQFMDQKAEKRLQNSVLDMAEDQSGKIWIGTDGGGLVQYDPIANRFAHYNATDGGGLKLSSDVVKSMSFDQKGNLYVGTYSGGLNYLDFQKGKNTTYKFDQGKSTSIRDNNVWSLLVDSDERVWVGTLSGLDELDPATGTFKHYWHDYNDPNTIDVGSVFKIVEDKQGFIWICSPNGGINRFDKKAGLFKRYKYFGDFRDKINTNEIRDLLVTTSGNLMAATNLGLCIYRPEDDVFHQITPTDRLESIVQNVLQDESGNYWLGTFDGIYKYNPTTRQLKSYNVGDGVQGKEFNYDAKLVGSDGTFYLGGLNGFNLFNPRDIKENMVVPPVVITGIKLFHHSVEPRDATGILTGNITEQTEIHLDYLQNLLTIEFAALDYSFPKRNRYAYILEGFDVDWNQVDQAHSATYTNLTPGNYTFRVIASNEDDHWNNTGAFLKVTMRPPFWMTLWFRVVVGLGLVAGVILIIRYRTYRIRERNRILEQRVKVRTETLAAMNEKLTQEVEVRKMAEQQLQRAMRVTEAANKAKSEFLANMSHEIRTPLNGIIGMTDLTMETELNQQQRKYLEIVRQSGSSLLNIINDILDISKIEAGKLQLESTTFNLLELIENVVSAAALQSSNKGLDIMYRYQNDVPYVVIGDTVRLKQIIVNLLNNAIKFTHEGEIFLDIRNTYNPIDSDHYCLEFQVTDTGIGVPADKIEAIFDTFTQVDASTTRKYGGSGLGLAICKKLVEMMNGRIEVESEEGKGSVFRFSVNLKAGVASARDNMFLGNIEWRTRRVLVIDTNKRRGKIFEMALRSWGLLAESVNTGEEAMMLARQKFYDVVLMDEYVPDVFWADLIDMPDFKIHGALTKFVLFGAIQSARPSNPNLFDFLNRPIRRLEMLECLERALNTSPVRVTIDPLPKKEVVLAGVRVLLVEDNPTNQMVLRHLLKSIKAEALVANNGAEALERFISDDDIDIILMDIQMPVMDGFEATKRIRQLPKGKDVPIIALTANAMQGTKEECLANGMDSYLTKPIKLDTLKQALSEYVREKS